jgi:ethanolamine utilization protein EutA
VRQKITSRLATVAVDYILGAPLDALGASLRLMEGLPRPALPTAFTFSGGVSEYIFGHENREYGDIAKLLATELCRQLAQRTTLPLIDPGQRIRATVIGASQFTVQVSGKTIYLPDPGVLPVHNVPVIQIGFDFSGAIEAEAIVNSIRRGLRELDLDHGARVAIAFTWSGDPEYSRLKATGHAIVQALAPHGQRDELLLLMIDGDVGRTFGRLLRHELNWPGKIMSIDGVQLQDLDFVDVGELMTPPGIVPVVIKSLLFS